MPRPHGKRFTKGERIKAAIRAREIAEQFTVRARAIEQVEDELDVSAPTARNLIAYGRYMARGGMV